MKQVGWSTHTAGTSLGAGYWSCCQAGTACAGVNQPLAVNPNIGAGGGTRTLSGIRDARSAARVGGGNPIDVKTPLGTIKVP